MAVALYDCVNHGDQPLETLGTTHALIGVVHFFPYTRPVSRGVAAGGGPAWISRRSAEPV